MAATEGIRPCWVMHCDNCSEHLGCDDYDMAHFETRVDAERQASESDWEPRGDQWLCPACADPHPGDDCPCDECADTTEEAGAQDE